MDAIGTLVCFAVLFTVWYIGKARRKKCLKKIMNTIPSIIICGVISIGVPAIFYIIVANTKMTPKVGNLSDWIGFWGSYLGSAIGVIGAVGISYYTTKKQLEESRHQLEVQLEESRKNELNNAFVLNDIKYINELLSLTIDINKFFNEELAKVINGEKIDSKAVLDTYNKFSNTYTKVLFSYDVEKENFSIEDLSTEANKLYNEMLSNNVDSINKKLTNMLSISGNLIMNHKKELDNIKKQIL